ncbi:questin oxidase family protein [Streptomyces albus subsp. chlorinus]|uniref:questin oxidase family protein n=1 Tax=Streptomyces albus TaxID=1888 RepID=UPI00156F7F1E|nr:questin oxidase family protein [Streptomyces albus]NSC25170.1 questin oxidase family protein [Streptomyces albus subsp. chlorinus]
MDTTRTDAGRSDTSGTLDEALERLHASGPEREGWLSNHAPMAVEALVRHGQAARVHRWIDGYAAKLEDMPAQDSPVTDANWAEALGDPGRLADWTRYFVRQVEERPWREVLATWWPRLLPGISGAATHPVIRTGHAVRTLLADGGETAPRRAELAHALGYWAARHSTLPHIEPLPRAASADAAYEAVPLIDDQSGGIRERLARITALPGRPLRASGAGAGTPPPDAPGPVPRTAPEDARTELEEIVRAATHRYATHAHGSPVMLVHAATAPNAVLRILPALPRELWAASVDAAWAASAAVTAVYGPSRGAPVPTGGGLSPEEAFARAAAHGDEHAIKFADTALDVAVRRGGEDPLAVAATLRATELIEPPADPL